MKKYNFKERKELILKLNASGESQLFIIDGILLRLQRNVLFPHQYTRNLIQQTIDIIRKDPQIEAIADIGTGSGYIALSMAKRFPNKQIYATDICKKTLDLAKTNALENGIKNVKFLLNTTGKWLDEIQKLKTDIIVSNPPFIGEKELTTNELIKDYPELAYEPSLAVYTQDSDGYSPFIEIFKNSVNLDIKYYVLQGNSENLTKILEIVQQRHGNNYTISLLKVDGKPRTLVARRK